MTTAHVILLFSGLLLLPMTIAIGTTIGAIVATIASGTAKPFKTLM